mmetsp:Transcript_44194/g.116135  ORF Transcript_44194/g.116135 Transcript_44194/m.116135 type:complete len:301 (-) Transcript_44194:26-928(-)
MKPFSRSYASWKSFMNTEMPSSWFAGGCLKPIRITELGASGPSFAWRSNPSWSTPRSSAIWTSPAGTPAYTPAKRWSEGICCLLILVSRSAADGASGFGSALEYSPTGTHASLPRTASCKCTLSGTTRRHVRAATSSTETPVTSLRRLSVASSTSSTEYASALPTSVRPDPDAAPPRGARAKKLAAASLSRLLRASLEASGMIGQPSASTTKGAVHEKAAPSAPGSCARDISTPSEHTAATVRAPCASVSRIASSARSDHFTGALLTIAFSRGEVTRGTNGCCHATQPARMQPATDFILI